MVVAVGPPDTRALTPPPPGGQNLVCSGGPRAPRKFFVNFKVIVWLIHWSLRRSGTGARIQAGGALPLRGDGTSCRIGGPSMGLRSVPFSSLLGWAAPAALKSTNGLGINGIERFSVQECHQRPGDKGKRYDAA